jgi:putative ABC transport system permease protein
MIKHILTLMWNKKRQNVLLLLEIFFAFLILFGVFSFAVTDLRTYNTPLGFDTEHILLARLTMDEEVSADSLARLEMRRQLRRELEAYPEVLTTSFLTYTTPFSGSIWTTSSDDNGFFLRSAIYPTDEQYAEAAGLNITEGRWYSEADLAGKYPPLVITAKLRDEYFGDKPILDSVIHLNGERKVVGIVENFKYRDEFEPEMELSFFLRTLDDEDLNSLQIRLRPGTPPDFEETINETIARVTKRRDFVIESLEASRVRQSRMTWIPLVAGLSICGFLILNVALGLFGVLFYNISKRRAEIGLRRTLGASRGEITRQFTLEVFAVALLGMLLAGLLAVQFPLLEVIPTDPMNYYWAMLLTAALISLVVLLCAFWPSRQAAQVHPATALHEE